MKIYVDLIIMLNFILDFLLLMSLSLILKRNASIFRITLGALIGGVSIIFLFINVNSVELFFYKVIISLVMILVSFGFKNIKFTIKNIIYLYLLSIILGGTLYFINDELAYKSEGLIFFHNGFSINFLIIIIISPIILFWYVKSIRNHKEKISRLYEVSITFLNGKKVMLTALLDTGNNLYDPYKKRPIIVINKDVLKDYHPRCILVPCVTVNKTSMLRCFRIKKLVINKEVIKDDCLVGISDNNFGLNEVDLLLHKRIVKGEDNL